MGKRLLITWLMAWVVLPMPAAFAQQTGEADQEETTADKPAADSGQVEANEDIYRQFMELKDGLQRRAPSPQDSWQSRSRLQKIDELPEESQKHLRNELREIIVEGGAWQPGDQDKYYPYVPSEAAQDNYRLQNREAEAWGELLDNYHAREAQIHANAARSRAASATAAMQGKAGQPGAEAEGRETKAGQAGQQGNETGATRDSFAPGAQAGSQAPSEQGAAQSALEFLQRSGYQAGSGQASQQGHPGQTGQQGQREQMAQQGQQEQPGQEGQQQKALGQEGKQGQANAQAQQATSTQTAAATSQAASDASGMSPTSQPQPGSEQSAMQYLQQTVSEQDTDEQSTSDSGQGDAAPQQDRQQEQELSAEEAATWHTAIPADSESADEGAEQSALEYLTGEGSSAEAQEDTLSIQDLLNAGGLGAEPAEDEEIPDKPDKDG